MNTMVLMFGGGAAISIICNILYTGQPASMLLTAAFTILWCFHIQAVKK